METSERSPTGNWAWRRRTATLQLNRKTKKRMASEVARSHVYHRVFFELGSMCLAATVLLGVVAAFDYKTDGALLETMRTFSFPPGASAQCAMRSHVQSLGKAWPSEWTVRNASLTADAAPSSWLQLPITGSARVAWRQCSSPIEVVKVRNITQPGEINNVTGIAQPCSDFVETAPLHWHLVVQNGAGAAASTSELTDLLVYQYELPSDAVHSDVTEADAYPVSIGFDLTAHAAARAVLFAKGASWRLEPVFTPRYLRLVERAVELRRLRSVTPGSSVPGDIQRGPWLLDREFPLLPCHGNAYEDNEIVLKFELEETRGADKAWTLTASASSAATASARKKVWVRRRPTGGNADTANGGGSQSSIPLQMEQALQATLASHATGLRPVAGATRHRRAVFEAEQQQQQHNQQADVIDSSTAFGFCEDVAGRDSASLVSMLQAKHFNFSNARVDSVRWVPMQGVDGDKCTRLWTTRALVAHEATTGRNYTFVFAGAATAPEVSISNAQDIIQHYQCARDALTDAAEEVMVYKSATASHACLPPALREQAVYSFRWTREVDAAWPECPNRGTLFHDWSSTQCGQTAHASILTRVADTYAPEVVTAPQQVGSPVAVGFLAGLSVSNIYHGTTCFWPRNVEYETIATGPNQQLRVACLAPVLSRLSSFLFRDNCGGKVRVVPDYANVKFFSCPGEPSQKPRGPMQWPTLGCVEVPLDQVTQRVAWIVQKPNGGGSDNSLSSDLCIDMSKYNPSQTLWRVSVPVSGQDSCGNMVPFDKSPPQRARLMLSLTLADVASGVNAAFVRSRYGCPAALF